jgi:hypothetical protein
MKSLKKYFLDIIYLTVITVEIYSLVISSFTVQLMGWAAIVILETAFQVYNNSLPVIFKFLGRTSKTMSLYYLRHGIMAVLLFSVTQSKYITLSYLGLALWFLILQTMLKNRARRVYKLKPPFFTGQKVWSPKEYRMLLDYQGTICTNWVLKLSTIELVMIIVPVAAIYYSVYPWTWLAIVLAFIVISLFMFANLIWVSTVIRTARQRSESYIKQVNMRVNPEVMLFFSGGRGSTYQANMWFPILEKIDKKVLVVFRERHHVSDFIPTTLPLLFLDTTRDLEEFIPDSVMVTLYVSNVGKNIHWLRNVKNKHIFIGHGDSDKDGSAHNLMKTYDHMLVAGEAHIERMINAGIKMDESFYIKVGRPQLELYLSKGNRI